MLFRSKLARGTDPLNLDGFIDAKASLHMVVMFQVRGIRSWSDGLQASFAFAKVD